ncbi:tol-pal system-associated acyl-CoA thioesterase [Aquisalinus flavus]|uniref:Tol-pal system-associated acyl-CoA thioesterase n=1 Tax=Aquisalinus flavus TaxID=1526572 RepID=A0A8J2Y3Q8_9PROT|nr:tol-pal system-associated acyl-CoA thioesterase [Aquisalinus flavus]GGD08490.1 tol-pal system-associated acyl-CoA thioesterase [Aquisalinus flavus]
MPSITPSTIEVRVYYEDTDFSGVVYHANYLKFFERGRTEALRETGIGHAALLEGEDKLAFTARRLTVEFIRPARIDDLLQVRSTVTAAKGARLWFSQEIWRGAEQLASAGVEIACISLDGKPRRLPADLMARLAPEGSGEG